LAETQAGDAKNWQDIRLESGKLFTVGDPKQSIYRFRGADITAYERFTDLMLKQGADKCYLQTNFRSSKHIIAYANAFGQNAIEETPGVQPKYVPIDNGKNFDAPKVSLALIEDKNNEAPLVDSYRHNQAQYIATWIKDNAGKTKLANGKTISYKDIAILLRTTTAIDIYTDALNRFDIKYTVEETKNFYSAQEISDIINILKVLNDPKDKTALLAVLRSPFAMIEDKDILTLSLSDNLNIFANIEDMPGVEAAYKTLRDLHFKTGRLPLDELLSEIIYNTGLIEVETLSTQKEQTIANILKFADVLRKIHGARALSLSQFLYYAENYEKEQNREGESPLAEESLDTVSIMTMHKAKGLEFPVVILTDISKKERNTKARRPAYIYDWTANMQGVRMGSLADGAFAYLEEDARRHSAAEELRILYVALTRAKERLLLVGDLKDDKNTISAALQASGCWPNAKLKPPRVLSAEAEAIVTYTTHQPPEFFTDKQYFTKAREDNAPDTALWLKTWETRIQAYTALTQKKDLTPSRHAEEDDSQKYQKDSAAVTGTICHRMLFNIFTATPKTAGEAALEEGLPLPLYEPEINEAQTIADDFTQSALFNQLKQMQFLAAEMPFTVKDRAGNIINGIIDAVFKTADGKIFIADYKSDNINKEDTQRHSLRYAPQLDLYKKALSVIFEGAQIQAAVIYLRTKQKFII
jgi:ATP-dependent helicase/nuclease subunit A